MDTLAVIIVNWNTGKLLARCVASLVAATDTDRITDIVVVDNASADDSLTRLRQELQMTGNVTRVHLIASSRNLGFAGGNNRGIRYLQKKYGVALPHILLLNPDTEVHAGAVTSLLAALQQHPRVGIVGPRLLHTDGTLQHSVRSFPTAAVIALTLLKLTRFVATSSYWRRYMQHDFNYAEAQAVDQVMGAAFLIRNTLLREIGLLDEGYFVWFEEVDYCKSAKEKGWHTWFTPSGEITHHGGVSFAQLVGLKRTVPWLKSSLHYAKKHYSMATTALLWALVPLTIALSVPAGLVHRQYAVRNKARLHV